MPIKSRSFVSILLSASFVAGLVINGVVHNSFALLTDVSHQNFSNIQNANTYALNSMSSLLQEQQHTQLSEMKLHMVKIISPTKGQQVPAGQDLTIFGISSNNSKTYDCKVSVIVNGNKPYRTAHPTGQAGEGDYSRWNFILTPSYTSIKEGQNKITAKFSCGNDPNLISHNSVNVTGVTKTLTYVANQPIYQYAVNNWIDKKLSSASDNNPQRSHPLSIILIPHIHIPHTKIPFRLPFH